ncbi:MAG: alpha/beta hydrolase fold domain-containing protein [Chloroflexota bacterium]|jgi:monoterpene epsilon-lactone hydrolase
MAQPLSIAARLMHIILRLTGLKRMFMDDARLQHQIDMVRQRQIHPYVLPKMRWSCRVDEAHIAGIHVITLTPLDSAPRHTLVYFHGGAYLFEPSQGHWQMLDEMVVQSKVRIVVPIYPRVPQYIVDDAVPALIDVLRHIQTQYGAVILAGDSAGGGLAVSLANEMRVQQMPPAQALILMSPWLDVTMDNPEIPQYEAGDLVISAPGLKALGQMWAGNRDPHDAWVSPLFADLTGMPPITMIVGGVELFVPDCRRFRDKALNAGVLVEYREFDGCMHAFMLLPTPEGRAARKMVSDQLTKYKENA